MALFNFNKMNTNALEAMSNFNINQVIVDAGKGSDDAVKSARKEQAKHVFQFFGTEKELEDNGEKNANRKAGRPAIIGTARVVPELFGQYVSNPLSKTTKKALVDELTACFTRAGILKTDEKRVSDIINAMVSIAPVTRYKKGTGIVCKGDRTLDIALMQAFVQVVTEDAHTPFVIADDGAISFKKFD